MHAETLLVCREAHCLDITLNQPDVHNCMSEQLIIELTTAFERANADPDVRLIRLQAKGPSFCSGADLNDMKKMLHYSEAENLADAKQLSRLMQLIDSSPKPTLAIVQGPVYGGGCGLVACCDIAIAAERATFCFSEVKLGLIPAIISPYVHAKIGTSALRRYFLSAERITAATAARLGLVHEVVADAALQDHSQQLSQRLLKNSPHAQTAVKALVNALCHTTCHESLRHYTEQAIADSRVSEQGQEGLQAFFDKRKPAWQTE